MGEAFLHNHGGMNFKGITATLPNTKYIVGAASYDKGALIYGTFGRETVRLHPSECVFSPVTIAADTTHITISKTVNGVTRSVAIPITVYNPSSTFGSNSWDAIAAAAYAGQASTLWNPGDKKTETIGGTQHTFRILGFNHNDLAGTDDFVETSYNGGSRKAAIALQFDTPNGPARMHGSRPVGLRYSESEMAAATLPALLSSFPSSMRNEMRLVDVWENKHSAMDDVMKTYKVQFKLYLPSFFEVVDWKETDTAGRIDTYGTLWREFMGPTIQKYKLYELFYHEIRGYADTLYKFYYHDGFGSITEWTRDAANSGQGQTAMGGSFATIVPNSAVSGTKNTYQFNSSDSEESYYFPIFNI